MIGASDYMEYVEPVRNELRKLIAAGKVTYYKDLGDKFNKPARWPGWKAILDEIARDKPDMSIIVLRTEGWQGQVGGEATDGRPTEKQKQYAQAELTRVFTAYSGGKAVPKLPIKRR